MGNIASFINDDLGIPVNTLPAEETGKLGLNKVLERPPFEQLPKHLQEFVRDLDGLEPVEQLNLIRQYTKDAIEYEANPNEQSDVTQNFSQTLANPKGDCDDIAVFEAGLIKYATEQGVAKFDDVAIVGGEISYDYQDSKGQARSADLSHNFLIISSNGQNFYSDPNAPQVGTFNQGNAVDGFLSGSDGSTAFNWYFAPTKAGAKAIIREIKEFDPETDLTISEWEIEPTRAGIAQALNDLIDQTCLNEG